MWSSGEVSESDWTRECGRDFIINVYRETDKKRDLVNSLEDFSSFCLFKLFVIYSHT